MDMQQQRERMLDLAMNSSHDSSLPRYRSPQHNSPEHNSAESHPPTPEAIRPRSASEVLSYTDAASNNHTRSNTFRSNVTQTTTDSKRSKHSNESGGSRQTRETHGSRQTKGSGGSKQTVMPVRQTAIPGNSRPTAPRPTLFPSDSSSTLVGSALDRKMNDLDSYKGPPDTTERLNAIRELMQKNELDY